MKNPSLFCELWFKFKATLKAVENTAVKRLTAEKIDAMIETLQQLKTTI